MDLNTLRGLLTLLLLILFICLFVWAYSKKRVSEFNEAANLPFADEEASLRSGTQESTAMSSAAKGEVL
ncbi:MAG TPA: CcoQ/FixQ family Cbb3-type cytochrome c oxidase assembly chaperone [Pseudomonadales bacterium]|nr:CcoQ/FixQ family Cbb3-type cytochrome c oxidase assembly chaperone [Pseudomonadales bacterium]